MPRYRHATSYNHRIVRERENTYIIYWTVDHYITNSRLRFPRVQRRYTDHEGALRFAKRWNCPMPTQER